MKKEMIEAAEKAIAFQLECAQDGKESLSHGFLYLDDGKVNCYAFDTDFMRDGMEKDKLAGIILNELTKHGGTFAFASDAWTGKIPTGKTRKDMPESLADWPEDCRQEVILCTVNRIGERGFSATQLYKRENDKIIAEPIRYEEMVSGRFIFDLTGDNLANAMMKAMKITSKGTA